MPDTTREERIAEYVARDAVFLVLNELRTLLDGEDDDVLARLGEDASVGETLLRDPRREELFITLWPDEAEVEGPEFLRANAEACRDAARILRTAVYHVDELRRRSDELFRFAIPAGMPVTQAR